MYNWYTKLFKKPAINNAAQSQPERVDLTTFRSQDADSNLEKIVQSVIDAFNEQLTDTQPNKSISVLVSTGKVNKHEVTKQVIMRLKSLDIGPGISVIHGADDTEITVRSRPAVADDHDVT